MGVCYEKAIDDLQSVLFQVETSMLEKTVIVFLDTISQHPIVLKNDDTIKSALETILKAYQEKDYLLLADVLEFLLKPLLAETRPASL